MSRRATRELHRRELMRYRDHEQPEPRGCMSGVTLLGVLALLLSGCVSRQFQQDSVAVLDVAHQLEWSACLDGDEPAIDPEVCAHARAVLMDKERPIEDSKAARAQLRAMALAAWDEASSYIIPGLKWLAEAGLAAWLTPQPAPVPTAEQRAMRAYRASRPP